MHVGGVVVMCGVAVMCGGMYMGGAGLCIWVVLVMGGVVVVMGGIGLWNNLFTACVCVYVCVVVPFGCRCLWVLSPLGGFYGTI